MPPKNDGYNATYYFIDEGGELYALPSSIPELEFEKKRGTPRIMKFIKDKLRELRLRFKLWRKHKVDCCGCCVFCKYFKSCKLELYTVETKHRGYLVRQSGLNNHITIYDDSGKMVYHAHNTRKHTEQELRGTVDFYLYITNKEVNND